jgi:hypothetical protein
LHSLPQINQNTTEPALFWEALQVRTFIRKWRDITHNWDYGNNFCMASAGGRADKSFARTFAKQGIMQVISFKHKIKTGPETARNWAVLEVHIREPLAKLQSKLDQYSTNKAVVFPHDRWNFRKRPQQSNGLIKTKVLWV